MARIKFVLNERRLALIEAQKQVREGVPVAEPDLNGNLFEDVDAQPPTEPPSSTTASAQPQA